MNTYLETEAAHAEQLKQTPFFLLEDKSAPPWRELLDSIIQTAVHYDGDLDVVCVYTGYVKGIQITVREPTALADILFSQSVSIDRNPLLTIRRLKELKEGLENTLAFQAEKESA